MSRRLKLESAVLVYQAGIANIFSVERISPDPTERGETRRILQYDFRTCENVARGLQLAGVRVASMACNRAGDIIGLSWNTPLDEAPFSSEMRPVGMRGNHA